MPIYHYRCERCATESKVEQRINDPRLTKCEACGEDALVRVPITTSRPVLKGGGWYRDGYSGGGS
jgi:putative FmdB family regulatory protein